MGDSCLILWGLLICFFFILTKVDVGILFTLGGIGHDALAANKFIEDSIVFGHGVSALVGRAADVLGVVALGCYTIEGLLQLRVNGVSSSWNFLVGLGIS